MTAITAPISAKWYVDKKYHLPLDVTWPRRIFSYQHVPAEFRKDLPKYSPFPYAVFLPGEQKGMFDMSSRKLVALTDDTLFVMSQEGHKKPVISNLYPLNSLMRVDYGSVLLQSWLKLRSDSHLVEIPFPTVADHLFAPIVDKIQTWGLSEETSETNPQRNRAQLEYLKHVNLKLFNAARKYLHVRDTVVETAYQPETELSSLKVFTWPVYRKYLTGHLAVLTDTAVVVIKENQSVASQAMPVYGGAMTYLPLSQIRHVTFEEGPGKMDCVMNVILKDNHSVRTEFSTETALQLERFKDACLNRCVRKS